MPPAVSDSVTSPPPEELAWHDLWPISVDLYQQMIRAGILDSGSRAELLRGRLVGKTSKSPAHETAAARINNALMQRVPGGWIVGNQRSIATSDSVPEPDVSLIRGTIEDYENVHPGPAQTGLVVEVAESSLHRDRTFKGPLYASAGIPCYWIANLVDRQIECYTHPRDGVYTVRHDYRRGSEVPLFLDGRQVGSIPVDKLI
ncbi:MAG: Uma2 family endonuclease [Acidobacteria bacterium]|nr:Uma2 family endonuclease [Acidobacteriota bacterium]